MRTSSRCPALWSFYRLPAGVSLSGRFFSGVLFLLGISLGGALGLAVGTQTGCTPGQTKVDENTSPPDLAMALPPPPPCQKDRLRCSADKDATEMCDGMTWKRVAACDTLNGEVCVEGACKKPCELVTRGNVGCSFYPVNLWSTSMDGKLGIVVTNTSDRLTAKVTLEDASGTVSTADIKPAVMGDPMGGVTIFRLDHSQNKLSQTELAKKAFHLTSTAPVTV